MLFYSTWYLLLFEILPSSSLVMVRLYIILRTAPQSIFNGTWVTFKRHFDTVLQRNKTRLLSRCERGYFQESRGSTNSPLILTLSGSVRHCHLTLSRLRSVSAHNIDNFRSFVMCQLMFDHSA